MSTTRWLGSVDTSWATAGNWDNGVPVSGSDVIVSRSATRALSTNLDRTGDNAVAGMNLTFFSIEDGHMFDVGSSGARLKITATKVRAAHAKSFHFHSQMGTGTNHTGSFVANGLGYYDVLVNDDDNEIVQYEIIAGDVLVTSSGITTASKVYVLGSGSRCDLEIVATSTPFDLFQTAGKITLRTSGVATSVTHQMSGGEFAWVQNASAGTIAELNMHGGMFFHDAAGAVAGRIFSGVYDATRTKVDKQITLAYGELAELLYHKDVTTTASVNQYGD